MGLLLYKRYVPVLLALAVSGTGTVTAGAASHGRSGTAGVGVTADAGKHAGRGPEQKPAADEAGRDGDRNPGGSTGSGQSTGGGDREPGSGAGSGGNTDGSSGESGGSGGESGSSGQDSGSVSDDGAGQGSTDSGGADGGAGGNSGMDTDDSTGTDNGGTGTDGSVGTGSGTGDGSSGGGTAGSGSGTGSGGAGDGSVHENNPDIQSGNGGSGPETASGQQKEKTAEQKRGSADTDKNPDSDGTAAEMPETESRESGGPESGERSRGNTGILWAAFLAAAAAVLAGSAVLLKRSVRRFHGILTDQKKRGIRIVRSRNGTDVSVPVLAGRLSSGDISFQDYKELLMGSSSATILPHGTKMAIFDTDGINAGAGHPEDADECRMLERLGKIADAAHSLEKAAAADVVLWNDRKDFEIRIQYVFRQDIL